MANEKRLIDANELLRIYKKWIHQLEAPEDAGDKRGVETCIAVLEDAPTVDAVEVVHGKWVSVPHKASRICSVCNRDEPYKFADNEADVYDYCPHCGAKMDGDGNG